MSPLLGLSLMPHDDFCLAIQPLFEASLVEVIEWSFDTGWGRTLPNWCTEVLEVYSQCDRLLGHGVRYSLLSAKQENRNWLDCFAAECAEYRYRHISEHFGWMAAGPMIQGPPLPMPFLPVAVTLGQARLKVLAEIAQVPMGLENLAFAFHRDDVLNQGEFLTQLLASVDGFMVLDIHNLYCQMHNFRLSAEAILNTYPLDKVREIHLSGGSWSDIEQQQVRRDTHDHKIPDTVLQVLETVLPRCPNLEFVIVERLGHTLATEAKRQEFQSQYQYIYDMLDTLNGHSQDSLRSPLTARSITFQKEQDISVNDIVRFQTGVLQALYHSKSVKDATEKIRSQDLHPVLEEYLFRAEPEMFKLAQHLVKKWGILRQ